MPASSSQYVKPRPFKRLLSLLVIVAIAVLAVIWASRQGDDLPQGVTPSDYERAASAYRARYGNDPSRRDVLSYLGELCVARDDLELAANCFRAIPVSDERYGLSARIQLGQVLIKLNRAGEAEAALREFLTLARQSDDARDAEIVVALQWLKYLMSVQLRLEERAEFLARLHELGRAGVFESVQYYFPHLLLWKTVKGRERLREFLKETPDDPQLLIAEGRYLIWQGYLKQARLHLQELQQRAPQNIDCLAALLECHYEADDWESFQQVLQRLPDDDREEPWLLLHMKGEFALHQQNWNEAVRHFERLLVEDPAHVTACLALSQAYAQLGQQKLSRRLQERTRVLSLIRPRLVDVKESNPAACEELADQCESIGYQEAAATFRRHAERIRSQGSETTSNAAEAVLE